MDPGRPDSGIPLWKLERYLIGELPPAEMERISGLEGSDASVAGWLRALRAEHADLQASHPTGRMAGRIWNKLKMADARRRPSRSRRIARFASAPAFALLLALIFVPVRTLFKGAEGQGRMGPQPDAAEDVTRLKGSLPALYLYRKAVGGAEALRPGNPVHAGDLIQVYYDAAGRKYGAIFSRDGEGKVTWHLPERGSQASPLSSSGKIALPSAFELDDSPGREDFHFVASDRPFPLDSILETPPRKPGMITAHAGISRTVFPLIKEARNP
ncbi:MAG: ActD [Fibrobacteres bacterium]|nr:ActD [Fibrobacterota bacterium]